MSRSAQERFDDILNAIERCTNYREYLDAPDEQLAAMAYDAVLRNLAVVGEAVRALPAEVISSIPDVPWAAIAGLRNVVIHEHFRVRPDLVREILDSELMPLADVLRGHR